jgi:hypothetical protein
MVTIILMSAVPTPTRSETQIAGAPGALSVDAHATTLQEVLATLSAAFGFQIRTSADLSRPVNGSYRGSLRAVITRLLDGYDFFVHRFGDDIEVVVVRSSGRTTGAVAPVASAAPVVTPKARGPFDRRGF